MRSDMHTSTITVAIYGTISRSWPETVTAWPAITMFWHLNVSPLSAPNAQETASALSGFHVLKMTNATEIQPAPAVMFSCHRGTNTSERYAPASPHNTPPHRIFTYLYHATFIPDASAAAGFSPTARTFSPQRVWR